MPLSNRQAYAEPGDFVRVQPDYRSHWLHQGTVEKVELQANEIFDDVYVRTNNGELLKTARHLVHVAVKFPKRIEKTSPTYARRLCREIRSSFQHGVYLSASVAGTSYNPRISGVMFSLGRIHLKSNAWDGWRGIEASAFDEFCDGYGRNICASTIA